MCITTRCGTRPSDAPASESSCEPSGVSCLESTDAMPMDHNQGRRGHFHRGRRGPDRRGPERRQGAPPDQGNRPERIDRVDVEQIMREIRTRIAQRSGIELSNQQIQELAARRLEAILDPRGLKPELLDQLRRSAGERSASADAVTPGSAQSYPFDEATLYDSPNALLRFIRKLLQPLLRMLFNPPPIAHRSEER